MQNNKTKQIIKKHYSKVAEGGGCCSCSCGGQDENEQIAKSIGYSKEEMKLAGGANLGLGCGNPVAMSKIKEGDFVLDLGCGAGFDCFLASERVGKNGKVVGVDMTEEMIRRAKLNAEKRGVKNVTFLCAEIENLPIKDDSVDIIITNCVINLTPDKIKTFQEAYRVLRKWGRMYLSDIVLLKELSKEQREDKNLLTGCVAGALLKEDYLSKIRKAGFKVNILH
ncbi:arsenite methyltransferase, partial [Patescibacteria group bacterium]|nr:arsenite methyltransferase [Patescibacteria group bacterium]